MFLKQSSYFVIAVLIGALLGGAAVGLSTNFRQSSAHATADGSLQAEIKPALVRAKVKTYRPGLNEKKLTSSDSLQQIRGRTQALVGHSAQITPTVLHPVVKVLVAPGQRVEKGQPLVELERHGPEADVRARRAEVEELTAGLAKFKATPRAELQAEARAELEDAQIALTSSAERLDRARKLHEKGSLPEGEYLALETAHRRAETEARADDAHLQHLLKHPVEQEIAEWTARVAGAQARLDSDTEELEHHTVCASISGVVQWLNVQPGTVTRPGFAVWGEIYDLSQIDVRAELTLAQIRALEKISHAEFEVSLEGWPERTWQAKVIFVGNVSDPESGLIPIIARVADADGQIPCKALVTLKLIGSSAESEAPKEHVDQTKA